MLLLFYIKITGENVEHFDPNLHLKKGECTPHDLDIFLKQAIKRSLFNIIFYTQID